MIVNSKVDYKKIRNKFYKIIESPFGKIYFEEKSEEKK